MAAAEDQFHLLEKTLDLIRGLEKNLALHKLDPATFDFTDFETRKRIHVLIETLDTLLATKERDPRLLKLITHVQWLRDFLTLTEQAMQSALRGNKKYAEWLQRQKKANTPEKLNQTISRIIGALDDWASLAEKKVYAHQRGQSQNAYLKNLPRPKQPGYFYAYVKELNPQQVTFLHPLDPRQLARQRNRTTEDLLRPDPEDPISGYRTFRSGDRSEFFSSGIQITQGHHRVTEIYQRYLLGEVDGDKLLLVKVDQALR